MARKPEIDINASQLAGLGNQDVKGREGRETVNPAELVAKAAVDWRNFLGSEIAVEEPTQKFLQY
jgi:hypothetical protein